MQLNQFEPSLTFSPSQQPDTSPQTARSRGFGFVTMGDTDAAANIIKELNGMVSLLFLSSRPWIASLFSF